MVSQLLAHFSTADDTSIGSNYNDWRIPVETFASDDLNLVEQFRHNTYKFGHKMSTATWHKSCLLVDNMMRVIHQILTKVATKHFPCLRFRKFVKQGSSREGLKIRRPDEFDMVLPFTIEGMDIQSVPALDSNGEVIPAYVTLKISEEQKERLKSGKDYESLRRTNVFEQRGSLSYLNAKNFQTRVISSIMDKAIACMQREINVATKKQPCSFTVIRTSVFPPTFRFMIDIQSDDAFDELTYYIDKFSGKQFLPSYGGGRARPNTWTTKKKIIDFDIVAAILLKPDQVLNPGSSVQMTCDRYAVMKWIHRERHAANYPDPELMWKESTCGYEKHIIDIGLRDLSGRYILTACRIMKSYLDRSKSAWGSSYHLSRCLTSYHIKNIAIHCLLFQLKVSGVKDALGYLIKFLEISLNMQFLPHFFYGNKHIKSIAPTISETNQQKRLNLFKDISTNDCVYGTKQVETIKTDLRYLFVDVELDDEHVTAFRELCTQNHRMSKRQISVEKGLKYRAEIHNMINKFEETRKRFKAKTPPGSSAKKRKLGSPQMSGSKDIHVCRDARHYTKLKAVLPKPKGDRLNDERVQCAQVALKDSRTSKGRLEGFISKSWRPIWSSTKNIIEFDIVSRKTFQTGSNPESRQLRPNDV